MKPSSAPITSWLTSDTTKGPVSIDAGRPFAAVGATRIESAIASMPLMRSGTPENENGGAMTRNVVIRIAASIAASTNVSFSSTEPKIVTTR